MSEVLSSWKEIALYLGKGIRTVQRWELDMGLPVRRPKPRCRQVVLAFPDEVDRWLHEQPKSHYTKTTATLAHMRGLLAVTMEQTRLVQGRTEQLRQRAASIVSVTPPNALIEAMLHKSRRRHFNSGTDDHALCT